MGGSVGASVVGAAVVGAGVVSKVNWEWLVTVVFYIGCTELDRIKFELIKKSSCHDLKSCINIRQF